MRIKYLLSFLIIFSCNSMNKFAAPSDRYASVMKEDGDAKNTASAPSEKNAKSKTWKRSNKEVNIPTIFVGDSEQLKAKGAQVSVKIDGFRARVLIDAFFYSDKDQQLEGDFKMRLPQGASPFYFAFGESVYLDKKISGGLPFIKQEEMDFSPSEIMKMRSASWSKPKVAKVVQKEKAVFAYHRTVSRQIDPALGEWGGADVFRGRVFPIMPKKLHRVVLGYDLNLTSIQKDWVYSFSIPKFDGTLLLDFDIANIPKVKTLLEPAIETDNRKGRKSFRITNPVGKEINIRYVGMENIVLLGDDKIEPYFGATFSPRLDKVKGDTTAKSALFVLDTSLSSNPDKFNIWLKILEATLKNNRETIKEFNVLLFNVEAYWWKEQKIKNTEENLHAFLAFANGLVLEGASDVNLALSSIYETSWAQNRRDNLFLLSDGSDTWGESDPYEMEKNIEKGDRLFSYNTGMSGSSIKKLNQLSRNSGGALFSVNGEDELKQVSVAFKTQAWKIEEIEIPGAQDILIQGRPRYLYAGQKLFLSGRGRLAKGSSLKLKVSLGGEMRTLNIPFSNTLISPLSTRIYGQIATGMLEEFDQMTKDKSIAYARHFKVPGKTCSFLMLESEADYQRFNIKPDEDAYVVKQSSVNAIIKGLLKDIELNLGSAKHKFKSWLSALTHTPGLKLSIPTSLNSVIEKTPESKFVIKQKALTLKVKTKSQISKIFKERIAAPRLDYDHLTEESLHRQKKYGNQDALKVLSSLVEKNQGDSTLARDVAYSALDWKLYEQAYFLFRRVLVARPYEPATYLSIAGALSKSNNPELALMYYEIVMSAKWNARFGAFRRIAALDYLHFLSKVRNDSAFIHSDFANARYKTLMAEFDEKSADLRVVISWNTDNTDIDLHIFEPGGLLGEGEECYYEHRDTSIGGHMTDDVTTGYGPEMYTIKKAKKGDYKVRVKYFASNRNRMSTRTKVYTTIYKNWGTPKEKMMTKVVTLEDNKEMHDIVIVEIP